MIFVTVKQVGDELAVILGDDARALLQANEGDTLVLSRAGDAVQLTKPDPEFEQRLKRGRSFFQKFRPTFEALAK